MLKSSGNQRLLHREESLQVGG